MAKEEKLQKSLEATLWDSCNKLRGLVEPYEYKHVMLSLIFLKYANDKFDEQRKKLVASDWIQEWSQGEGYRIPNYEYRQNYSGDFACFIMGVEEDDYE